MRGYSKAALGRFIEAEPPEYDPEPGDCAICGGEIEDIYNGDLCCWVHEQDCAPYPRHLELSRYGECECNVQWHVECCLVCKAEGESSD